MSLTRNLYRFDEVRASFLLCLKYRRKEAAIFWLTELEESCYSSEARRLLLVAWVLFVGCGSVSWIERWSQKGGEREGRLELALHLLRFTDEQRDSSMAWLLWFSGMYNDDSEDEAFWEKVLSLYDDVRLDPVMEALQIQMRSYAIFAKVAGWVLAKHAAVLGREKETWKPLEELQLVDWKETIQGWKASANLRVRRVHAVLRDSFFGMTWRGKGADTTEALRNLSLDDLAQSAYWKTRIPASADRKEDAVIETFWDEHFGLSDHPDEWSLEDQQKSHGRGGSRTAETPLIHWWTLWISPLKRFVSEEQEKKVLAHLKHTALGSCASVLDLWNQRSALLDPESHTPCAPQNDP